MLHLPTLRVTGSRVHADLSFTRQVPRSSRDGHVIALGVDWGLSTLLSAGAVRQGPDGAITALGAGGQYRASGVLAKAARLRRHSELLQARQAPDRPHKARGAALGAGFHFGAHATPPREPHHQPRARGITNDRLADQRRSGRLNPAGNTAFVTRSRSQRQRSEIPPWKATYSGWTRSGPHFSL